MAARKIVTALLVLTVLISGCIGGTTEEVSEEMPPSPNEITNDTSVESTETTSTSDSPPAPPSS